MGHRFHDITGTPAVHAAQAAAGSRNTYARFTDGPPNHDRLGPDEAAFIAARDSAYLATVSETGWPYLQHRGGPAGFLAVVDEHRIVFADYRGNRQYITVGNIAGNDRASLFLMDYPNRRRLKLLGRLQTVELANAPDLARRLAEVGGGRIERGFVFTVEAFDWNCPQHITPRFTQAELEGALSPIRRRLADLETENAALRAQLTGRTPGPAADPETAR